MEPVAIESEAQREAMARARAELWHARFVPVLWTTRILVLLVGAPVALLGITAGMMMARQERNGDALALAALTNRMEQRLVACIADSDDALPVEARYTVEHGAQASIACDGVCPALACALSDVEPLLRQAPFGFTHTFAFDFTFDRVVARDRAIDLVLDDARPHAAFALRASDDGARYVLSCAPGAPPIEIAATFRERTDVARIRAAIARCAGP